MEVSPGGNAHPKDPVQSNPFSFDYPGHGIWNAASRQAELKLLRFEQNILSSEPVNYEEDEELHVRLYVGRLEIWAERGMAVVRDYAAARYFEQWLAEYVKAMLADIPMGMRAESFIPKLNQRLLRAVTYWSANALEQVAAIEAEGDGGPPAEAPKRITDAPGLKPEPKKARGRPAIPAHLKDAACVAKAAGAKNGELAKILYETSHPTRRQQSDVSNIMRNHKPKVRTE